MRPGRTGITRKGVRPGQSGNLPPRTRSTPPERFGGEGAPSIGDADTPPSRDEQQNVLTLRMS